MKREERIKKLRKMFPPKQAVSFCINFADFGPAIENGKLVGEDYEDFLIALDSWIGRRLK